MVNLSVWMVTAARALLDQEGEGGKKRDDGGSDVSSPTQGKKKRNTREGNSWGPCRLDRISD